MSTYLTKSRFQLALDCPTKLYYHSNPDYANTALEDPFLAELAKGGFQVGALAQCMFPGGTIIPRGSEEFAALRTLELLKLRNTVIYEAAFIHGSCLVRVDVLVKKGNRLQLIEVKAKSFAPSTDTFLNNKGDIRSEWISYLEDVAFQTWVARGALIHGGMALLAIEPFLMLANKEATASVSGINQRFFFDATTKISHTDQKVLLEPELLGAPLLVQLPVDREVQQLLEASYPQGTYAARVAQLASALKSNTRLAPTLSKACKKCEYQSELLLQEGKNGFRECWTTEAKFSNADFMRPMVWDVWDFRKSDVHVANKNYFMEHLDRADFEPKAKSKSAEKGMSRVDRQELQVIKTRQKDKTPHVLVRELREEMESWVFPLHMIDFETSAVALPFYAGMHPYETVAFQFSHHVIFEDGSIEHRTEWLHTERGVFPSFSLVRALKQALDGDNGSVFRYAVHENTVLNMIHLQLENSSETDKKELQAFIETITYNKDEANKKEYARYGDRCMIDLCGIIKKYYYHPLAGGSNSIKYILPAILNSSKYLQDKYRQPVYGTSQMPSYNFENHTWIKFESGMVINPYQLLPPVFSENDDALLDVQMLSDMTDDPQLQNGGAAMAAFGLMQFTQMSEEESIRIQKSLLRYCELDTLAMVMIYEELTEQCR